MFTPDTLDSLHPPIMSLPGVSILERNLSNKMHLTETLIRSDSVANIGLIG